MAKTRIEWADRVWNPVTGCTKVSDGCRNCYAETMAKRFWKDREFCDVQIHYERLAQPLNWKIPARVFVNSMSDLFHDDVPIEFVDEMFDVMSSAERHTFMILTKRPLNMWNFFLWKEARDKTFNRIHSFKNVWLGVSVEDQKTANERIPLLLKIPAAVRFVNCEPLLEKIELDEIPQALFSVKNDPGEKITVAEGGLDWVIVGGESGKNARPMHPDWVRSIRDCCISAEIPFFFKQWGEWQLTDGRLEIQRLVNGEKERILTSIKIPGAIGYQDAWFRWVGKKAAGRMLDGKKWSQFPVGKDGVNDK